MTATERKRLHVIRQVIERRISQKKAAKILGLSVRQIKRIGKQVRTYGDRGVIHSNRNRQSNRRTDDSIKKKVVELAGGKYKGFGPTLLSECLRTHERIALSDETIRLWMKAEQLPYAGRKARAHRRWRERKSHLGEMLQMDGSHHDWLEGRGPKMVMMGYIDDATGLAFARFYGHEGTIPAFDGLARYFRRYGMPCSVYLDKHTTYKGIKRVSVADQLEGDPGESQFQRAMKELGIQVIHAHSPQAKGRIERFFRTCQDRLVKEMRVAGICSMKEANLYLDTYLRSHNRKFCVTPAAIANLHRPVPPELQLKSIFSVRTRHFVRNDFTVVHNRKIYQLSAKLPNRYIVAEERIDGSFHLMNGNVCLRFKEIHPAPKENNSSGQLKIDQRRFRKPANPPAKDHPWRQLTDMFTAPKNIHRR